MLTLISPAAHRRLTTVEAIKVELALTGGTDDACLEALIDQASDAIAAWCGRSLALEGVRETLYRDGWAGMLMLSRWPVVSIEAVMIGGAALAPGSVEVEDGGLLHRLDDSGQRVGWPSGRMMVEYSAGYILPGLPGRTLPKDIERAAITLVKAWFMSRARDPQIKAETVDGIGSTSYGFSGLDRGFSLPPEVEGLLAPYRAVGVL